MLLSLYEKYITNSFVDEIINLWLCTAPGIDYKSSMIDIFMSPALSAHSSLHGTILVCIDADYPSYRDKFCRAQFF